METSLKVKKIVDNAILPKRGSAAAAGYDLSRWAFQILFCTVEVRRCFSVNGLCIYLFYMFLESVQLCRCHRACSRQSYGEDWIVH